MEDNNNSFLVKVIAGTLILILALNVFRTESTKKQMDCLATAVDSLAVRVDALEYPDFSEIASEPLSSVDGKKVADLAKGLSQLQTKVTALQEKVNNLSSNPSSNSGVSTAAANSSKDVSELTKSVSDLQSKVNIMQKTIDRLSIGQQRQASSNQTSSTATTTQPSSITSQSSGRVSVTSKVKVEDRYVEKTALPQVSNGPEGIVVVNVTIDPGGNVSGAKIGTGTTINDEEILDKCKEAALKSKFNINVYVSSKHPGTITYTFTAK